MKNYAHAALAAGMAGVFTLGSLAGSTPAAQASGDTPDGAYWYIGTGNAYGAVIWDDYHSFFGDADVLTLDDDLFPSGYSVKMTVDFGSYTETVHATSGGSYSFYLGSNVFTNGEQIRFKACAWDNGEEVTCRPWTTVTE